MEKYKQLIMVPIGHQRLGGDETAFGKSVFLILMELTSGFIFTEALVEDRKLTTWQKCMRKNNACLNR